MDSTLALILTLGASAVAGFYMLELSHFLTFLKKDQQKAHEGLEALNVRLDALLQRAEEEKSNDND